MANLGTQERWKAMTGTKSWTANRQSAPRFRETGNRGSSERAPRMTAEELRSICEKQGISISDVCRYAQGFGRRLGRSTVQNWKSGQGDIPRYLVGNFEVRDLIEGIAFDRKLQKIGALIPR